MFASLAGTPARADQVILKLGHTLPDNHAVGLGALRFKQLVEQRTNGAITVQIFPNNILGGEPEMFQQEKQGSIQAVISGAGTLGNLEADIAVLEAPYLWKDFASEKKVLTGPMLAHFQREFTDRQGMRILSMAWYYGRREFNPTKAVRKPEDAAGMKIRTPPSPVNLLGGRVLGGNPVPMNFPQVYLAIKTGTIDAEENPLATIDTSKMYEVAKYIVLTHHIQQSQVFTINQRFWASLSRDQQNAIQSAVNDAGDYEASLALKAENDELAKLRAMPGVTIIADPDIAAFKARARKLIADEKPVWASLYDRFEAAQ
ncbi:MAG: TRAP transporter substrate-binding protein [Candidatus Eremiobacteraeota bacterium]|nr:TRAP transporter substrate-binding protein [Candidatus Eremiobacteraeota bacterium]MBV8355640.1 TRAP transporter substrate-binding protein [Candidatus Eremiobacteraeota bacterium]